MLADRLDHLDRSDPVVAVALVAIVLQPDLDLVGEARLVHALAREVALLGRDREADDACAERLGGELGEAAPAAADLEQLLARLQVERLGEPAVFVGLRGREVRGALVEQRPRNRSCSGSSQAE